jgi:hypothetical protein
VLPTNHTNETEFEEFCFTLLGGFGFGFGFGFGLRIHDELLVKRSEPLAGRRRSWRSCGRRVIRVQLGDAGPRSRRTRGRTATSCRSGRTETPTRSRCAG